MDIIQLIHNGYLILLAVRLLDLGVIPKPFQIIKQANNAYRLPTSH